MERSSKGTPLLSVRAKGDRAGSHSPKKLRVASLFAGVGGIELGLQRSGHRTTLFCEKDPAAIAVLANRFPGVPLVSDVCEVDRVPRGTQLLTAGFPCQDLSQAGTTRGIAGGRSGLVREVLRLLEHDRVPWVLLENVPFMLQLARGRALEVIVGELEALGYRWAYRVVDTRSMGLPQRRERIFLLASIDNDPRDVLLADDAGPPSDAGTRSDVACGFYWTEGVRGLGWAEDAVPTLKGGSTIGIPSPPAILLPSGRVVTPDLIDAERLQGFDANWTEPAEEAVKRSFRWKLVGNAVTVDVAAWIGRRLLDPGTYSNALWDQGIEKGDPWPRAAWNVGNGRFASAASSWPLRIQRTPLHSFLKHDGHPLSERATAGFLSRTSRSSLRFRPGFLAAVGAHLEWIREASHRSAGPTKLRQRVIPASPRN